jgi:signal peptidase I
MDNLKPKEPLLAVMLTVILSGLGQIYAGKIKRGIILFLIPLVISILLISYLSNLIFNPNTGLNSSALLLLILLGIVGFAYAVFVMIDSYRCAKEYNMQNNLTRNITSDKKYLIAGIIFFIIFNPLAPITRAYVRNRLVQAFRIPTGTMKPTLMEGDLILADKAIYKKSEPKRGDVIVFIYPEDTKKMFVKRLVGLPGETIEIKNGGVLINGTFLNEPPFSNKYYYNRGDYGKEGQSVKIPADSYFVLGDNSNYSKDSRYWGFVPKKNLVGKAYKIYFPFDRSGPIK